MASESCWRWSRPPASRWPLVGARGRDSAAPARVPSRSEPMETIFEAQSELFASPGPTLDILKRLGVERVKVFMPWNSLTPEPLSRTRPRFDAASPAAYPAAGWSTYDAIFRAAAARRIGLDVALEAPAPHWAIGHGVPGAPHPGSAAPGSHRRWNSGCSSTRLAPATAAVTSRRARAPLCPGSTSGRSGTYNDSMSPDLRVGQCRGSRSFATPVAKETLRCEKRRSPGERPPLEDRGIERVVQLLDPVEADRDLGVDQRVDDERTLVSTPRERFGRPVQPAPVLREDVQEDVALDEESRHPSAPRESQDLVRRQAGAAPSLQPGHDGHVK